MLLIGSANAMVGMDAGWAVLAAGGSALDAVEATINAVEDDPADRTVGYGGLPGLLGDVELDASIADGETRRAGAVAALRGYRHAITVARAVMERTPHVLLAGEGAAMLADEVGLAREELLTAEAREEWRAGLERAGVAGADADGRSLAAQAHATHAAFRAHLAHLLAGAAAQSTQRVADPKRSAGTVNVLAVDRDGRIVSGVSTSGWPWAYPGRVGDSAVIGAGNYADSRYGAASCTGSGEQALRAGTACAVVSALARGASLEAACEAALSDLCALDDVAPDERMMNLIAVDRDGRHHAVTSHRGISYVVREDGMDGPELRPRHVVDLAGRPVRDAAASPSAADRQPVRSAAAPGPTAGAPYAQAIRAGGFVFVSGQLPVDVTTGELVAGGIAEQTEQAMRNLQAVLEAAGSSLGQLVKTTVFLRSRDDWPVMNDVYRRFVGASPPARTALEVGRLGRGALVEIDAIARVAVPDPSADGAGS